MLNRRVPEASSLRQFFQDQWEHLLCLANGWQEERLRKQQRRNEIKTAVETLVDGTDARLRSLGDYQHRLRHTTRDLLLHIEDLIADLPPPLLVNKSTLVHEPVVRRLFKSPKLVSQLFDSHVAVKDFFSGDGNRYDEAFIMLFLFRDEKRILGSEMRGEIIMKDVLQTMVSFVGHEIAALHPSEEQLRSALKRTLFESVVDHIKIETIRLRMGLSEEEQRLAALNPDSNICNPHVYIDKLQQILASPKELLRLENRQLTIDRMGIKVPDTLYYGNRSSSDTIHLPEVAIGDNRSKVVCLVRYPNPKLI